MLVFTPAGPCCSAGVYAISVTGTNWVVDGFKVQSNYQRGFVRGTGSTGLTFKNNRVEISPYYGENAINVVGTSNVTIQDNWVRHFPGCVNDASRCASGGYTACDFVEDPAGVSILNAEFSFDGTSPLVFEGNDFGYFRNPTGFRNITGLTIRRNRCTNATNHSCFFANDVKDVLVENNIGDIDTDPACTDGSEILQSGLWDTYCAANVTLRNNTVVGHGIGWQQELANQATNAGASSACTDSLAPEVGANGGYYQHFLVYNNLVYDGKSGDTSYTAGMSLSGVAYTGTAPRFRADNNLWNSTSGPCIAVRGSTTYCSLASWRAADVDGDGVAEDMNGKNGIPQFVSYAGHNYAPASSAAPQVNAGANTSILPCPATDFSGAARSDGLCDIGAHEFAGGSSSTPPANVENLTRTDHP